MTSATLKVEDSFSYITSSLELSDFEEYGLESDFDYSKQALLYMPTDLGSIKNNSSIIKDFFIDLFKIIK
jgi:Rad3-related DNA helicase